MEDSTTVFGDRSLSVEKVKVEVEAEHISVTELMEDQFPSKRSWLIWWSILVATMLFTVLLFKPGNLLSVLVIFIVSIPLSLKSKKFSYDEQKNYYVVNLSNTLRAFLRRVCHLEDWFIHAKTLVWIGMVVSFIEIVVLRAFLFYPLSITIHLLSSAVFIVGIMMLLSNRKSQLVASLLNIAAITSTIAASVVTLVLMYVPIQVLWIAMLQLILATLISKVNMQDIKLKKEENTPLDNTASQELLL